jgi:hypothetical protein
MAQEKYFLAIDFDFTITVKDRLTKAWGDKLARKLNHLKNTYPIELFLLSVASMSYILQKVFVSGSSELLKILINIPLITNEDSLITRVDHKWGESVKNRKEMIKKITHTNHFNNIDYIIAYKKTSYLLIKSKLENSPHSHVFFLDDNRDNIRFASYYGFQALLVDNEKKEMSIFDRLDLIEGFLKKNLMYHK